MTGIPAEGATDNWRTTKEFIGRMMEEARAEGLSDDQTRRITVKLVDNLLTMFPADSGEELAMRSIWLDEDQQGKESMIRVLFAMCDPRGQLSKVEWEEMARMMARSVTRVTAFLGDLRD